MNAEPKSTTPTQPEDLSGIEAPKSSFISIWFVLIVIVLIAIGFSGKWAMEKFFFMQESAKATSDPIAPPEDLPRTGIGAMSEQSRAMGGGGGRRGRGNADPAEMFASQDTDENGKLEGDEIGERMQGRMEEIDSNEDGAISKEEFLQAVERWRSRRESGDDDETPSEDDKADQASE